ncbi:hypothetical protein J7M23_07745 [Candidatus Sumerlaeota bacterium]|nr:hypothetical protein [Candidatus Sumerlaeota bacterium]
MKSRLVWVVLLSISLLITDYVCAKKEYNFRESEDYKQLSESDREKLEKVHRDMILLWGALDIYADRNGGKLPNTLDELVPSVLKELPTDPFATTDTARQRVPGHYTSSKDGWGYRYMKGSPGNRAWVIYSVGLPGFPYLAKSGNVGLYICKGIWISGINPISIRNYERQSSIPGEADKPGY